MNQLIEIGMVIVSAILVMIMHELSKSLCYMICSKTSHSRHIFQLHQYIDPVGLLLCIVAYAGFSKPYMFRIKDKKTNFRVGLTGFLTLLIIYGGCIAMLRWISQEVTLQNVLLYKFFYIMALISFGMFLVNLFPISVFDMGLVIAGQSSAKYFSIIQNDLVIKTIFLFVIFMKMIMICSVHVIELFVV